MDKSLVCLLIVLIVHCYGNSKESDKEGVDNGKNTEREAMGGVVDRTIIVEYTGNEQQLKEHLKTLGYDFVKRIAGNFYKVMDNASPSAKSASDIGQEETTWKTFDKHVMSVRQDKFVRRVRKSHAGRQKRFDISDPYWVHQWYLTHSHSPSMQVFSAWDRGFSGSGVTVAIVDDGIEHTHPDLQGNFNLSLSYDFLANVQDPSHKSAGDGHGTNCAGIVAAGRNDVCVIGIAYNANLPGIRLLGSASTESMEAEALVYNKENIAIYSNSWGPYDSGRDIDPLPAVVEAALYEGVTQGRGGLGNIYTWAGGNGRDSYDDCSADGYAGSPYTIAVASLGPSSASAYYSEACPGIMCATYGGDSNDDSIATTDTNSGCVDDFQGTSASTPVASGILALVLEANGNLTWRDIQHMIVEYSTRDGVQVSNPFYTNGAGKRVSLDAGFGLLNAMAMVLAAPGWATVPNQMSCNSAVFSTTTNDSSEITSSIEMTAACQIRYIEHVVVEITYQATSRGGLQIFLLSPNGTQETRLFNSRHYDSASTRTEHKILTLHQWGEDPNGIWTLRMVNTRQQQFYLYEWKFTVYGTLTDPLVGKPGDGELGGYCNGNTTCDIGQKYGCYRNTCIYCGNGFSFQNGGFCVEDGSFGGRCNDTVLCESPDIGCNTSTSLCELCEAGYHGVNGVCMQDGIEGGLCGSNGLCNETEVGCNVTLNVCVNCSNGFSVIENFCIQDGTLGGYCANATDCEPGTACALATHTCIVCTEGYHIINRFCVKDGTTGGFCDLLTHCLDTGTACNTTTGLCAPCDRERMGYCFKTDCWSVHTNKTGSIKSPNFPSSYPHNSYCEYIIIQPSGTISLSFDIVVLRGDNTCSTDFVEIYDGGSLESPLLGKFCQPSAQALTSSGRQLYAVFVSDASQSDTGFKASYSSSDPHTCGGLLTQTDSILQSPNYPNSYPSNAYCTWYLIGPSFSRLVLQFNSDFLTECNYDYLSVYEGRNVDINHRIGRYCSSVPAMLVSSSNNMVVTFTSDGSVEMMGFSATFSVLERSSECGGFLDNITGVLESLDYPAPYLGGLDCNYYIINSFNVNITIAFETFDLQDDTLCADFVEIYNGVTTNGPAFGPYCGSVLPPAVQSTSTIIRLHFVSDQNASGNHTGFRAIYSSSVLPCGEHLTSSHGTIQSPLYPLHYPLHAHCVWYINVSAGNHVLLTINGDNFHLEESQDCSKDYVAVYEGALLDPEMLVRRLCGNLSASFEYLSSSNVFAVEFVSDLTITAGGFTGSYSTPTPDCTDVFTNTSGTFTSPNYPLPYINEALCVWYIHVPIAFNILLTFSSFDVELGTACNFDYVVVYDGLPSDNVLGKFCGDVQPNDITSTGNAMTVKFISDGSITKAGFEASYSAIFNTNEFCGGHIESPFGSINTPNHPRTYPDDIICHFYLENSIDRPIQLTFEAFDLPTGNCSTTYVRLQDGIYDSGQELGVYCGSVLPESVQSPSNILHVTFVAGTMSPGQYTGFNATYSAGRIICGENLTATMGPIMTPNYPDNYPVYAVCKWFIQVQPDRVINFTTLSDGLQLEESVDCSKDYLSFYDGRSTESRFFVRRLCGSIPHSFTFTSTTNEVVIEFVSDLTTVSRGVSGMYSSLAPTPSGCVEVLNSTNGGTFTSPNYPLSYRNNENCSWTIHVPSNFIVILSFSNFDVEESDNCSYDRVIIHDGDNLEIARFCGSTLPGQLQSTGTVLTVLFISDALITSSGFDAEYTMVFDNSSACGGLLKEETGLIQSPNYPAVYPNNSECHFYIELPLTRRVFIAFESFSLPSSNNCADDYVLIQDGFYENSQVLGLHCGSNPPPSTPIKGSSNVVHITFVSGATSAGQYTGFNATYLPEQLKCGENLTVDQGSIQSPSYPNNYSKNSLCTWRIRVTFGRVVSIKFDGNAIALEESANCTKDYLSLYDGDSDDSSLLSRRWCGSQTITGAFESTSNEVVVLFNSDLTTTSTGFRASFFSYVPRTTSCNTTITSLNGDVSSPNYPSLYNDNVNCVWTIILPSQLSISLKFSTFDVESSAGCIYDYVQIFDGTFGVNLVGRYCGSSIPNNVVSSGNVLAVHFKSDNIIKGLGFTASYEVFVNTSAVTVTTITNTSGLITSPRYPNNYPNNYHGEWRLQVSTGKSIRLQFLDFNLQNGDGTVGKRRRRAWTEADCLYDQVLVLDGYTLTEDNVLGRFCGSSIPPVLQSSANVMSIRLVTDQTLPSRGFHARFEDYSSPATGSDDDTSIPNSSVVIALGTLFAVVTVIMLMMILYCCYKKSQIAKIAPESEQTADNNDKSDCVHQGPSNETFVRQDSNIGQHSPKHDKQTFNELSNTRTQHIYNPGDKKDAHDVHDHRSHQHQSLFFNNTSLNTDPMKPSDIARFRDGHYMGPTPQAWQPTPSDSNLQSNNVPQVLSENEQEKKKKKKNKRKSKERRESGSEVAEDNSNAVSLSQYREPAQISDQFDDTPRKERTRKKKKKKIKTMGESDTEVLEKVSSGDTLPLVPELTENCEQVDNAPGENHETVKKKKKSKKSKKRKSPNDDLENGYDNDRSKEGETMAQSLNDECSFGDIEKGERF